VSRGHALIKKVAKGEYYLEDSGSKFGTLVQVKYPIKLCPSLFQSRPLAIQTGKTLLHIKVSRNTGCLSSTCCSKPLPETNTGPLKSMDASNFFPLEFYEEMVKIRQREKQKSLRRQKRGEIEENKDEVADDQADET